MARFTRWFGNLFSTAGGFAVGSATADTLRPALQEVTNHAWETHPSMPLDAATVARADRIGAMTTSEAKAEARRSGVSADRYQTLYDLTRRIPSAEALAEAAIRGAIGVGDAKALAQLGGATAADFDRLYATAGNVPTPDELLELSRRGAISDDEVDEGLRLGGLRPAWRPRLRALSRRLLSLTDVARLAVHEVYTPELRSALQLDAEFPPDFLRYARLIGLSDDDARDLWAGHWDLPSYTQGAEMMFRGELTAGQFDDLLRAQDYAPTWRGKLAAIARRIPTMSDFQRLARREVYNPAQRAALDLDAEFPEAFAAKAALHGMTADDARDLWAGGWRLPSATQGYRMLWRDEIDEGGLAALLKALDYAPTWRGKLANIARPVLGRVDIRRAFAIGVIDRQGVIDAYRRLGYEGPNLDALVRIATAPASTSASVKELTAAQLAAEYEGGFATEAEFRAGLDDLGYPPDEIARYVALGDARRVARARTAAINRIRSSYVGHKIARTEAAAALEREVRADATRDLLLTEWDNELSVNVRVLTQAQVLKLYKKGVFTAEQALDELTDQGLSDEDARLLLATV